MKSETPSERHARIEAALKRGGVPSEVSRPIDPDEMARAHADAVRRLGSAATRSESERHLSYWSDVEMNLRASLATVRPKSPEATTLRNELGAALAELGRFDEAATLAPKRKREFARLADALARADDESCDCADFVRRVDHPTEPNLYKWKLFPRYQKVGRVLDYRTGQLAWLVECLRCSDVNAVGSLPPLLQQRTDFEANNPKQGQGSDYDLLPDATPEALLRA